MLNKKIELEEMDYHKSKDFAKEQIRGALLTIQMQTLIYEEADKELRKIWSELTEEQRKKRENGE